MSCRVIVGPSTFVSSTDALHRRLKADFKITELSEQGHILVDGEDFFVFGVGPPSAAASCDSSSTRVHGRTITVAHLRHARRLEARFTPQAPESPPDARDICSGVYDAEGVQLSWDSQEGCFYAPDDDAVMLLGDPAWSLSLSGAGAVKLSFQCVWSLRGPAHSESWAAEVVPVPSTASSAPDLRPPASFGSTGPEQQCEVRVPSVDSGDAAVVGPRHAQVAASVTDASCTVEPRDTPDSGSIFDLAASLINPGAAAAQPDPAVTSAAPWSSSLAASGAGGRSAGGAVTQPPLGTTSTTPAPHELMDVYILHDAENCPLPRSDRLSGALLWQVVVRESYAALCGIDAATAAALDLGRLLSPRWSFVLPSPANAEPAATTLSDLRSCGGFERVDPGASCGRSFQGILRRPLACLCGAGTKVGAVDREIKQRLNELVDVHCDPRRGRPPPPSVGVVLISGSSEGAGLAGCE